LLFDFVSTLIQAFHLISIASQSESSVLCITNTRIMMSLFNKMAILVLLFTGVYHAQAQRMIFEEWKNLTTSGKLPSECKLMRSNNNLDLRQV
jgi:hypothetical protein